MPLTAADIKFFGASKALDTADGGGPRTGTALQTGLANTTFSPVTAADRISGRLNVRKLYAGPLSDASDALLSASVVIDELASTADVEAAVWAFGSETTTRADAVTALRTGTAAAYGVLAVNTETAAGAGVVSVERTSVALAPRKKTLATSAGSAGMSAYIYFPTGQTRTFQLSANALTPDQYRIHDDAILMLSSASVLPGSLGGTVNGAPVPSGFEINYQTGSRNGVYSIPAPAMTYELAVWAKAPLERTRYVTTAVDVAPTLVVAVPVGTLPGSESVRIGSYVHRSEIGGTAMPWCSSVKGVPIPIADAFDSSPYSVVIDRINGTVTVLSSSGFTTGTVLDVFYSSSTATAVPFGNVSNSGTLVAGQVTISLASGHGLDSAVFRVGGIFYEIFEGTVRASGGGVAGSYIASTGVLTLPGKTGTIDFWAAASSSREVLVSSVEIEAPASLTPSTLQVSGTTAAAAVLTGTANGGGVLSGGLTGQYAALSGRLSAQFPTPVKWNSIQYSGALVTETLLPSAPGAISATSVQAVRPDDICTLWHETANAPQTASVGVALSAGRTGLHEIAVIDSAGVELVRVLADGPPSALGTADLVAGIFTPSTVAGWAQPVTLRHRIAYHTAVDAVSTSTVTLRTVAPRTFPSGSFLSPHLPLGDLGARVAIAFSQQAWTLQWSSTLIGNPTNEMYVGTPTVTNDGAETDRYVAVWSDAENYVLYSERRGRIGAGTKAADYAPLNANTGEPLVTLLAASWAANILVGSAYRFDVVSSFPGYWALRNTSPGPGTGAGTIAFALQGGVGG